MRPKERRETGEQDLFRSRLDQIIDLDHALAGSVQMSRIFRTFDQATAWVCTTCG